MKKISLLSVLYSYELEQLGKERGLGSMKDRDDYINELVPLMGQDEIISLLPELLAKRSKKKSAGIGKGFLLNQLYNYEMEHIAHRAGLEIPEGVTEKNRDEIMEELTGMFTVPKLKKEFDLILKKRGRKTHRPPESLNLIISRVSYSISSFIGQTSRSLTKTVAESLPDKLKQKGIVYSRVKEGEIIHYGNYAAVLTGYGDMDKSDFIYSLLGKALFQTRKSRFVILAIKEKKEKIPFTSVERGFLQDLRIFVVT